MGESYVNNVKATSRSHVKKMFKLNVTEKDSLCVCDATYTARSLRDLAGSLNRDTKTDWEFEINLIN